MITYCRFCREQVTLPFCDLGTAPPSNRFVRDPLAMGSEPWLPLRALVCAHCRLVQLDATADAALHRDIFGADYAYFSSYSATWLAHARRLVDRVCERRALGPGAFVVEVASNDGYLLQFAQARGLRCLGIEPTAGTAQAARAKGIATEIDFFDARSARRLAERHGAADWIVANNVLAHVPDLNDFVAGFKTLLAADGCLTLEFPHLLELVRQGQFDTIYHEHFCYFSFTTAREVLRAHALDVIDVERLPTHGGSLRLWVTHQGREAPAPSVQALLNEEAALGIKQDRFYAAFQAAADAARDGLLGFLHNARRRKLRVLGYGAAAKGNTLLNYARVTPELLPCVADVSPHKQGCLMPGSRIPVVSPEDLLRMRPDVVLILPWNLRAEIARQLAPIAAWGGRLAVAVPRLELFDAHGCEVA